VRDQRPIVAVVDDDPRLIESLENLLESAGYRTRCFSTAGQLVAGGFSEIDVLITDIGLPGIDGFELRDRALRARPDLPVFLITGRHELTQQSDARGIAGCFRKPFDVRVLLSAIGTVLRERDDGGKNEN
jgi:FixJ family two-component response regulator